MPKAKPDHVQVHRIEFGTKEREHFDKLMTSNTVKNYAQAAEAALIPLALGGIGVGVYFIAQALADEWSGISNTVANMSGGYNEFMQKNAAAPHGGWNYSQEDDPTPNLTAFANWLITPITSTLAAVGIKNPHAPEENVRER
jgi:hypothetical protein